MKDNNFNLNDNALSDDELDTINGGFQGFETAIKLKSKQKCPNCGILSFTEYKNENGTYYCTKCGSATSAFLFN